jgi:hypothetical protein
MVSKTKYPEIPEAIGIKKMANTTLYIPEWYQKKVIPVQHWFCVGYLLGFLA